MRYSVFLKNFSNEVKKSISQRCNLTLTKPMQVMIMPSKCCNARCLMCNFWHEKEDILTAEEIIAMLRQLKKMAGSGFFVQLSGGEVLIYKGIYDIFSYCADNGIICKISTNGIAMTESVCDKIIQSRLAFLSVSIDSHIAAIHDKYRGVAGTWERSVNGIKYLAQNGNLTLGISSILMKENIASFAESVEFFLSLPINRLLIQPIGVWTENLPRQRWHEYEYWINDRKAMADFSGYLLEKRKYDSRILNTEADIREWSDYFINPAVRINDGLKKCHIGYDRISINCKGDVNLGCGSFGIVGNIKTDSIRTMWHSAKAKKIRRQMAQCRIPCTYNCYKDLSLIQKVQKAMLLLRSGLFDRR